MAKNGTVAYVAKLPDCDICKFDNDAVSPAAYDGRTKSGHWAFMCEEHFDLHGVGVGLGKGQKLEVEK